VYGHQKAAAEKQLGEITKELAIVRFGKAIPSPYPRFMSWHNQLKQGLQIRVLSDLKFAPLSSAYLVHALATIKDLRMPGIFHLSPETDLSYAQVGEYVCQKYAFNPSLVISQTVKESGISVEYAPRFAALGCAASLNSLALPPPLAWEAVDFGLPTSALEVSHTSHGY
jgi:dTDP-4-dehydrorhamnose reductase